MQSSEGGKSRDGKSGGELGSELGERKTGGEATEEEVIRERKSGGEATEGDLEEKFKKGKKSTQPLKKTAFYLNMAFEMGAIIVAGCLGGRKLDEILGLEKPIMTLILTPLSSFVAIYICIKNLLK